MKQDQSLLTFLAYKAAGIVVGFFTWVACLFILLILLGSLAGSTDSSDVVENELAYHSGDRDSSNKILSIPINGLILGDKDELEGLGGLFSDLGVSYGYEIKEQLYEAAENDDIKGVILEINSPGGTIYGSQAISDGVKYYRDQTKKPVISFINGLAASGGYWAAAAGDSIVADYGTSIGSIGVITGPFKYYNGVTSENAGILGGGVVTQQGIETFYITAGEHKDLGNPYRKMSETEVRNLQQAVNNEYEGFVTHVASHRKIEANHIKNTIKALIYDPSSALQLKLIDQVANRETAYEHVAKGAHLPEGRYQVVREESPADFVETILKSQLLSFSASHQRQQICSVSSQILAYHGNVVDLCSP
ncbi:MAG TPA: S49 family peptidase [Vitreimonas sp.]|nr:S49 family peptidase [Vitreimonas sp.]